MDSQKLFQHFLTVRSVSTDTRKIKEGDIFFALKGANFNGNMYAAQALDKGASMVVIDESEYHKAGDEQYVLVEDALLALQKLARSFRQEFSFPFIGITGSNGKTTTKELIYSVLSQEKKVHATKGNLNNHIGVPLTLLSLPAETEIAIVEMGANQPGDIKELVEIALPSHTLLTNIGQAHLERFGSLDGVQKTKGEMHDFVRKNGGESWVNQKDERVLATAKGITQQVTFGTESSDFYIQRKELRADGLSIWIAGPWEKPERFDSVLLGDYSADNVLAAVVTGVRMGISLSNIKKGISSYLPTMNRTQILQKGEYRILMDAYNANPSSMKAAIGGVFDQQYGKVGLLLGDMFELGEASEELHRDLGKFIGGLPVTKALFFGKEMRFAAEECADLHPLCFDTAADAKDILAEELKGLDLILIKGSRGMALEQVLEFLPDQG